jgi:hypothetical protein
VGQFLSGASRTHPHALLSIDQASAAASVLATLNAHGGERDHTEFGAIAWNDADGALYYADTDSTSALFIDRITPGTWSETTLLSGGPFLFPSALSFAGGKLWLWSGDTSVFSADAANIAGGVGLLAERVSFPSPDGPLAFAPVGLFPIALPCTPSRTAACLANRFKVEVSYDARPANGMGAASVVLESPESVKFTFFNPANIELILKILDACSPPFNRWWVFAGGLTDVGVSIKVTDSRTGMAKNYTSTKGKLFQPFADTSAFNCP